MDEWTTIWRYFPAEWQSEWKNIPRRVTDNTQEIRVRLERPLSLSLPNEEYSVPHTECSPAILERLFCRLCDDSVYAHEEELRQGYIAVSGGIRVGVAGTAVFEASSVRTVRSVTSLCIRLPRRHAGCAADLVQKIWQGDYLYSTLLIGSPSSGKTTLLRDSAAILAERGKRVSVVDEREELSGAGCLSGCDVLRSYPKTVGIRQALRCLAPEVILFDELGSAEEARCVIDCAHAGVAVITSAHGEAGAVGNTPIFRRMLENRTFDRWVFLCGRKSPGQIRQMLSTEEMLNEMDRYNFTGGGRERAGYLLRSPPIVSRAVLGETWAGSGGFANPDDLHDATAGRTVAGYG